MGSHRWLLFGALLLNGTISGCSSDADTVSGSNLLPEHLHGIWTCEMQKEQEGVTLAMTGHTTYASTGYYEATGLGIVYFDNPYEQIRWVATSSGSYRISDDELTITTTNVEAKRLFAIGFSDVDEETLTDIENDIIDPINNSTEQTGKYTITLLTDDRLDTIDEDGNTWNCRKDSEATK